MSTPSRVFVGRLTSLSVFDPLGDQVGRVRDVVVTFGASRRRPRVIGLVVEVPGRRRVFVPMTRVTSVDGGQVITTGLVNMRRFEQRTNEALVMAELLERTVHGAHRPRATTTATVEDVAIEQRAHPRLGRGSKVFVRQGAGPRRARAASGAVAARRCSCRSRTSSACTSPAPGAERGAGCSRPTTTSSPPTSPRSSTTCRPSAAPRSPRRWTTSSSPTSSRSCPRTTRSRSSPASSVGRAADVLEAMEPDDAADLLHQLPKERQEELLQLMEPDEAADLRRLLTYDENTAGGLMTTEPVILGPEASIAEALAVVRRAELSPALASTVFVCRAPLETPTGRYLGIVHIQRLLREPPHASIGGILDKDVEPLAPDATLGQVTRMLATYNLVGAAGRRRRGPPARRGHRRRRARPHPPRGLARGAPRA